MTEPVPPVPVASGRPEPSGRPVASGRPEPSGPPVAAGVPASPAAADFDLRLVRYFTVVAEHLHFGRAAQALRVAQPSLSRQIRRLEEQLGARLLERTPQGSRLTEAGEVFLPRARALLRAAAQASAVTRAAAEPGRFVVGYTTGLIVTPAVRELRRKHPQAQIQSVHVSWQQARTALPDRRVDALVTRLPFPTEGLEVTVLYSEPRVLVVPLDHRLAGRESVTLDDIADEPLPRIRNFDPDWSAFWRIDPRPDGRPAPGGPVIDALEDKFEVVAAGEAVAIAARVRGVVLRPDLTSVPLEGVEPSHVVLAVRSGERGRLAADFRSAARRLAEG